MTFGTRSRVTVAFIVVCFPFIVWAVRTDAKVERLEDQSKDIRVDLKEVQRKLDDIRERLPPRDRSIRNQPQLQGG